MCLGGYKFENRIERKKERQGMREREHRSIKVHGKSEAEQHNTRITKAIKKSKINDGSINITKNVVRRA